MVNQRSYRFTERLRKQLLDGTETALGQIDPPFAHKDWPDIEAEIILPLVGNMRMFAATACRPGNGGRSRRNGRARRRPCA